jgi:type VI secretion system protein ImpA
MNMPDLPTPNWYANVEKLLSPIPGASPCGPSLRYDPAMAVIRQARETEDPGLPMGHWERPLKSADWSAVQSHCVDILSHRSKDLQVASWLLEAATVQQQLPGLQAGIDLLCGLIERHWEGLHPLVEQGDTDARVAPLAWLNESLPLTLRLHINLLELPSRKPPRLNLAEWQGQLRQDAETDPDPERALPPRDELLRLAGQPSALGHLLTMRDLLRCTTRAWARLSALIDERLGQEAPSLGRVDETLLQLSHAVEQLVANRDLSQTSTTNDAQPKRLKLSAGSPEAGNHVFNTANPELSDAADRTTELAAGVDSRESAYRALEHVADYLQRIEPHSPTPYLIRRAVNWGRLPLPELMQEVLREEGDLNRLFTVLGLSQPAN